MKSSFQRELAALEQLSPRDLSLAKSRSVMLCGNTISNFGEARSRRQATTRTNAAAGSQESADSRPARRRRTRPPHDGRFELGSDPSVAVM